MHRRLRELDRLDARESRRTSSGEGVRQVAVALGTIVLVLGFAAVTVHREWGFALTAHGLTRQTRLAPAPVVPTGLGSFRFLHHQPGEPDVPVAYDPCKPIHLVVNDRLAPAGGVRVVREAVRRIAGATGLSFIIDGTTDRRPPASATAVGPTWPGQGWPPVLVAWTTPTRVPGLMGDVAGLGGSEMMQDPVTLLWHYVTGTVSLDAPTIRSMMRRPGGTATARAIVMHELGHVVGLAHVADPDELMNARNVGLTEFGPGDREGLADLGRGRCFL